VGGGTSDFRTLKTWLHRRESGLQTRVSLWLGGALEVVSSALVYQTNAIAIERAVSKHAHLSGLSYRVWCYQRLQCTENMLLPVRERSQDAGISLA
jgi:hypothetical protein